MTTKLSRLTLATSLLLASAAYAQTSTTGPSTASTPYGVGLQSYVKMYSVLTVDNTGVTADDTVPLIGGVGTYGMTGIPDGLGAFDSGGGEFTLLMHQELGNTAGVARAHGATGAFVAQYTINKNTLAVTGGKDLITSVSLYNTGTSSWDAATTGSTTPFQFNRFCSADLPAQTALFNSGSGLGSNERIFMSGEESGANGRAFGTVVSTGVAYELPHLGKFSWENSVASPLMQDKTIVMGLDDSSSNGGLYMYVGTKTNTGREIDKAGLTNGNLFAVQVAGLVSNTETRALDIGTGLGTPFTSGSFNLISHGNVANTTGTALNTSTITLGGTNFLRPEDGAWDTQSTNKFYFVTTDQYDQVKDGVGATVGRSRLWSMDFTDMANPDLGGTINLLLDGTEAGQMYDNLTVDTDGKIILQEDVGGQAHNGKLWSYNPANDSLTLLAKHDTARFGDIGTAVTAPYNNDEEFSGIIDITSIMTGSALYDPVHASRWYAMVDQAHYTTGITAAQVQGGQLLIFSTPEPSRALFGMIGLGAIFIRRRRA